MNYNYTACCWFPTSSNILILPSKFWQIRFESYWLHCSKCRILVLIRYPSFMITCNLFLYTFLEPEAWSRASVLRLLPDLQRDQSGASVRPDAHGRVSDPGERQDAWVQLEIPQTGQSSKHRGGSRIFIWVGHKRLCVLTHITSAKPKIPYVRGPGPF